MKATIALLVKKAPFLLRELDFAVTALPESKQSSLTVKTPFVDYACLVAISHLLDKMNVLIALTESTKQSRAFRIVFHAFQVPTNCTQINQPAMNVQLDTISLASMPQSAWLVSVAFIKVNLARRSVFLAFQEGTTRTQRRRHAQSV